MVFLLRYNFLFCSFLSIGLTPLILFLTKFTLWSVILDIYSRLHLNLYYVNSFQFFWTSLWYLYLFFIYLVFLNNFFNLKYFSWITNYILSLFFIVNFTLFTDIFFGNILNNYILLNSESCNMLLKNSVNRIHPFLLYSATMLFFQPKLYLLHIKKVKTLNLLNFTSSLITYNLKKSSIYILVALYLGSWWALQEGSWGGWWNWDASEFLGLLILYLILTIFHDKTNIHSFITLSNSVRLSLSYLFIFFLLLQLNFNIISHNFGFRTLKFLNTEVLLFSFLSYFLINYFYIRNSRQKLWTIMSLRYKITITHWFALYLCLLAFNYVIILSLLSFFFKTLLNLKFFFGILNFNKLLVCLFILIFIFTLNPTTYFTLALTVFSNQIYCILLASVSLYTTLRNFLLHYSLYILLLSSLFYKYSTLNDQLYTDISEVLNYTLSLTLNNREIEVLLNFITDTTSFEGKSFDLIANFNYISQVYFLNCNNWHITVTTIDNLPTILNSILILSLTSLIHHFLRRHNFTQ